MFVQGLKNEQMGKMVGSLRPDWLWVQLRHHGCCLPQGNAPLFWACGCLSPGPSSFPPYPSTSFSLHRQAGQVWGHKPAGPEHFVAAAAPALPAPSAGHGLHLLVTGWAHRGHRSHKAQSRDPTSEMPHPQPPPHTPRGGGTWGAHPS